MSKSSFLRPRSFNARRPQPQRSSFGRPAAPQARARFQGAYIHPSKFINRATIAKPQAPYEAKHSFLDFELHPQIARNLSARGYTTPTPIQDQTIPAILAGRDVIGLANTGTGKTAAFLLPILHQIMASNGHSRALIMAPTRELASQIFDEFLIFAKGTPIGAALCVGGMNISRQIQALRRGPHLIIGTPGRLKDLFNQHALNLNTVNILVLDEADRMLDMGFINDIRFLVSQFPAARQSLCFSATFTPEIAKLAADFLTDPLSVSVKTTETCAGVDQDIIVAQSKEQKLQILQQLLSDRALAKVLIFGQTKHGVQKLAEKLSQTGTPAEAIHGNKSQPQRQRALDAFKRNAVRVLCATDVAARGLDIPNVSHVINFDQPNTYDDYVHRIGRTGRAGQTGVALTFVAERP